MKIKAIQLGQSIDTKRINMLKEFTPVAKDPYLYKIGRNKWISILRYGVITLWNIDKEEEKMIIKGIEPFVENPLKEQNWETIDVKVRKNSKPQIKNGVLYCEKLTPGVQRLVSFTLARSVVLEFFEKQTDEILKEFSILIKLFSEKGRIKASTRKLLKLVGHAMKIKNSSINQMSMLEKPDFTWDDAVLDKLYEEIDDEYELNARYSILREKISTLFEDSEFILNYLESKRSMLLEVVIIVLIAVEIVLFVYELGLM